MSLYGGFEKTMMIRTTLLSLSMLATLSVSLPAFADAEDKAACEGLANGADCVDGDGQPGACLPDDSDPNVLSCEDMDTVVCLDKQQGDACVDEEGDAGKCVLDDDGTELECEDDAVSGNGGGGNGGNSNDDDDDPDTDDERDADRIACADLSEGDECTEDDGDAGACKPDDSDPNVLECDDDALAGSSSSGGCSAAGTTGAASTGVLVGLALALSALRGRKRASA